MPMSNTQSRTSNIRSYFKIILFFVIALTVLCFIGMWVLVFLNPDTKAMAEIPVLQGKLYGTCDFGWKAGFGAILGLIGGNLSSQ